MHGEDPVGGAGAVPDIVAVAAATTLVWGNGQPAASWSRMRSDSARLTSGVAP
jgi:hypothetical protein